MWTEIIPLNGTGQLCVIIEGEREGKRKGNVMWLVFNSHERTHSCSPCLHSQTGSTGGSEIHSQREQPRKVGIPRKRRMRVLPHYFLSSGCLEHHGSCYILHDHQTPSSPAYTPPPSDCSFPRLHSSSSSIRPVLLLLHQTPSSSTFWCGLNTSNSLTFRLSGLNWNYWDTHFFALKSYQILQPAKFQFGTIQSW